MEYIEVARALGVPDRRILNRYVLRHSIGPIVLQSMPTADTVILPAALLSPASASELSRPCPSAAR